MPTSKHVSKRENKAIWIRALFILLYCVVAYVAAFIVLLIAIFQFVSSLVIKRPNDHLLHFSQSLSVYLFEIIYFITFNTEDMPFPFKAWPSAKASEEPKKHH